MQEELLKRLDLLATKLGVAVEHLWAVLVRQGTVEGVIGAFAAILGGVICLVSFKNLRAAYQEYEDGTVVGWAFLAFMSLIAFAIGVDQAKYLFNPEYFALQEVLRLLK